MDTLFRSDEGNLDPSVPLGHSCSSVVTGTESCYEGRCFPAMWFRSDRYYKYSVPTLALKKQTARVRPLVPAWPLLLPPAENAGAPQYSRITYQAVYQVLP